MAAKAAQPMAEPSHSPRREWRANQNADQTTAYTMKAGMKERWNLARALGSCTSLAMKISVKSTKKTRQPTKVQISAVPRGRILDSRAQNPKARTLTSANRQAPL